MRIRNLNGDSHRAGPGASTVLLILLVICLAMLGALSLSVAKNDFSVTTRALQAEEAYYLARTAASNALSGVDNALLKMRNAGLTGEKWLEGLREVEGYDPETGLIFLDVPVDEYRSLCVKLRPLAPDMPARYEIIEDRVQITPRNGE